MKHSETKGLQCFEHVKAMNVNGILGTVELQLKCK
jgi:hypothetical protein